MARLDPAIRIFERDQPWEKGVNLPLRESSYTGAD
jgi:hypothetical protein